MSKLSAPIFRTIAILLSAAALVVGLAACGSSAPADGLDSGPPPAEYTSVVNQSPDAVDGQTVSHPLVASTADVAPSPRRESASQAAAPEPSSAFSAANPQAAEISSEEIVAAFEDVLSGVYERVLPSVVYIRVQRGASETGSRLPDGFQIPEEMLPEGFESPEGFMIPEHFFRWGQGSGFVWDEDGHVVTNYHVVDGAEDVTVFFADSTQAKGTVVGSDPHSDLAVIKLEEGDWSATPVELGDSSVVRVGQLSVAIGAPFGQDFTMTSGIISAIGRSISSQTQFRIPEAIQTDSAINPGNSGGPLLDRRGRVIGINTQIVSDTGNYSGVGLAVPVNIARRAVPALIADGEFNYSWLGVTINTVNPAYAEALDLPSATRGAMIVSIIEDSPADDAGLSASDSTREVDGIEYHAGGDLIIAIDGREIIGADELIAHLTYMTAPGDEVTFTVLRDGRQEEIEVTLGERPGPTE